MNVSLSDLPGATDRQVALLAAATVVAGRESGGIRSSDTVGYTTRLADKLLKWLEQE
jgi:hypothetical protein